MTTGHLDGWSSSVFDGVSYSSPHTNEAATMVKQIVRFMREEEGATAVEYVLMVALIAVTTVGLNLQTKLGQVGTVIGAAL